MLQFLLAMCKGAVFSPTGAAVRVLLKEPAHSRLCLLGVVTMVFTGPVADGNLSRAHYKRRRDDTRVRDGRGARTLMPAA